MTQIIFVIVCLGSLFCKKVTYEFPCKITNQGNGMEIKFEGKFFVGSKEFTYENGIPEKIIIEKITSD